MTSNKLRLIVFTGVSGGGKTTALRAAEDLGFYCVDNLPLPLLEQFIEVMESESNVSRVGLVADVRVASQIEDYAKAMHALRERGYLVEVVYLEARDEVLLRRFSQTRRRHPLTGTNLRAGFEAEKSLLAPFRNEAQVCIDTSDISPHQLKRIVFDRYQSDGPELGITLISFGFRYGVPTHADLVLDVRFLSNPYFVDELRHRTGKESVVASYVLSADGTDAFLQRTEDFLRFLIPRYRAEGRIYLTIAVGCTGGRHRSVAVIEELARRFSDEGKINVRHRDVER